ncbi:hypothetical protein [Shimazuella kribbensis]|uniref:hypothetical protein n=1 Tax=Shimazuella kribbensis TaxID=139808 RepID=UPI0004194101|nr:hypothetical protein [Shimazuella kribbensis]
MGAKKKTAEAAKTAKEATASAAAGAVVGGITDNFTATGGAVLAVLAYAYVRKETKGNKKK